MNKKFLPIEVGKKLAKSTNSKYDWLTVRRNYVEGTLNSKGELYWPTMAELAEKHNIPCPYLRLYASENKWTAQKQNYRTNYEHVLQEEKIKHLAKKSAKFDVDCINLAEEGIKHIKEAFKRAYEAIDITENKESTDNGLSTNDTIVSLGLLESAAKTLEKFQRVGRLALGSSTDNIYKNVKQIQQTSFSEGLDKINKQIKSNPKLEQKIESELAD